MNEPRFGKAMARAWATAAKAAVLFMFCGVIAAVAADAAVQTTLPPTALNPKAIDGKVVSGQPCDLHYRPDSSDQDFYIVDVRCSDYRLPPGTVNISRSSTPVPTVHERCTTKRGSLRLVGEPHARGAKDGIYYDCHSAAGHVAVWMDSEVRAQARQRMNALLRTLNR
jgi:hypothetical protein